MAKNSLSISRSGCHCFANSEYIKIFKYDYLLVFFDYSKIANNLYKIFAKHKVMK